MPELPHFNPSVSVFHFSSKVSNAKIQKYKLATERGMVNASLAATRNGENRSEARSNGVKKSQVKPSVPVQVDLTEGDTIQVVHPRKTTPKTTKRTWNKAFGADRKHREQSFADGEASSSLSSADSNVSSPATMDDAEDLPQPPNAKGISNRESYGDLMSYYIQDDDTSREAPEHKSKYHHTASKSSHQRLSTPRQPPAQPATTPAQQAHQARYAPHPTFVPPPRPTSQQQQSAPEPFRVGPPDPVPVMIEKLQTLSQALIDFGGAPARPPSPEFTGTSFRRQQMLVLTATGHEHFTYESQPIGPGHWTDSTIVGGQHDAALTYGIQFIINALQSWATQRLSQLHMQALADGRNPAFPMSLAGTPEGRAIAAFRAVVESGCLRVATVIPRELSRSLRLLYYQIDHLINQGGKRDPPWRCLSYRAQIEANLVRISNAKDEMARAEQEMVRQHQLAHQTTMRQMGLPAHLTSTMFYQSPADSVVFSHDPRRSSHDLIRLPEQAMEQSLATQQLPQHMLHARPAVPGAINIAGPPVFASHDPRASTALLSRSGQSMKLSFPPSNSVAIPPPNGLPQHGGAQLAADIKAAVEARIGEQETAARPAPPRSGFVAVNSHQE